MSETVRNTEMDYFGSDAESPSEAVVSAVAAAEGVDETALQPLYDVCDPDALNSIFRTTQQRDPTYTNNVQFQYHGYTVRVRADGQVTILD